VKTQKWPREVDFKLPGFLVEVRGLLGFRYVTSSPSTPFHWLFEYDRRQGQRFAWVSLCDKQPFNAISLAV
jgi:hypothetical protein